MGTFKLVFQKVWTSTISRSQGSTSSQHEEPAEQSLPLRSLWAKPVVISIVNYGTLALLDTAASALIPLTWSTAIELGGLGLTPASIGLWISVYGCVSAVFQFAFFPRVVAHFGAGAVAFGMSYALFKFPSENMLARGSGMASVVWPLIVLQLVAISVTDMGLGVQIHVCFFRCAGQAIPWRSERSCALTDGRLDPACVGPAAASLFAFSLHNNVCGQLSGQFAYALLLSLACVGPCVAYNFQGIPGSLGPHF
ncbi:hypothetical protein EDB83DRAFT_545646 [Lactarius deliciosus]|nr:hypothetical protein EDB83DRAFT_545646 [Lactarius deliciosus]